MLRLLGFFLCLAVLLYSTEGSYYFQRTCERRRMDIDCGSGVIDIRRASYGRKRSGLCGGGGNTNCHASNSMSVVSNECDGLSHCSVHVDNSAFGDPCVGTVKYLEVTYRCVWSSSGRMLKRICERDWGTISCYGDKTIYILSAYYGRKLGGHICPGSVHTTSCSTSATSEVSSDCDYKKSCDLHADNHHFGDPCVGTTKYLEVRYRCQ